MMSSPFAKRVARSHLKRSATKQNKFRIEPLESRILLAVTFPHPAWIESGPDQITNGQLRLGTNTPAENLVIGAINDIAVDPNNANNVVIGSTTGGLWRTTDGGANWDTATEQAPSDSIGAVAFNLSDSTRVYAGTAQATSATDMQGDFVGGLFRSTNGGQSWGRV